MSAIILPENPPAETPPEVVRTEVKPGMVKLVPFPSGMTEGRAVQYVAHLEPVPGQPGLWREVRRTPRPLVKLTDELSSEMGWGLTRRDLLTLAYAGMVRAYRPGLQTTLIDPASVWVHLRRTRLSGEDGGAAAFWRDAGNVRAYSEASAEVVSRGLVPRDFLRDAKEADAGQTLLAL